MLAVDDDGEVTSATSAVDLKRPLVGPLPAADLKLERGLDLAPATEAVDLRRAGGSSARPPCLHWIRLHGLHRRAGRCHKSASWPPPSPVGGRRRGCHPDAASSRRFASPRAPRWRGDDAPDLLRSAARGP